MLTGMDFDIESTEKRKLAEAPKVPNSLVTLNKWPKAFELYFGDRLGFRQILIGVWSSLQYHLLGSSVSEEVIVGEDGWLFYGSYKSQALYRRFRIFSENELNRLTDSFTLFRQWMECRNIKLLLVVAPNKSTIYPEKMPIRFNRSVNKPVIDQVAETARSSGVAFVDFRDTFYSAKQRGEKVYYKTDTHWNSWGSYLAYEEIGKRLSVWFPAIQPIEKRELKEAGLSNYVGGLAEMHGAYPKLSETSIIYSFRTERMIHSKRRPDSDLPGLEKSFLLVSDYTQAPDAILYRDSFSIDLIPYMQNHFHNVSAVWSYKIDLGLIEQKNPQVVIVEVVERFLPLWVRIFPDGHEIFQKEYGVWFAYKSPKHVGFNFLDKSGFWGDLRVGKFDDKNGFIVFGPFTKLSIGRHQVTFRAKVSALSERQVATFDVAGEKGRTIFAKRAMTAAMFGEANKWQDITLDFTLNEAVSDAEFRVYYEGGVDLAIDYIRHQALDDEPSPAMACMNKKLPLENIMKTWTKH